MAGKHWDTVVERLSAELATNRAAAVAALAIGWPADDTLVELLAEVGRTDEDRAVRQAAVRAVGQIARDDRGLGFLADRARSDINWIVRCEALRVVAAGWPDDRRAFDLLCASLADDAVSTVREIALRELVTGWAAEPDTLELVRAVVTTDPSRFVRQVAAQDAARLSYRTESTERRSGAVPRRSTSSVK